MKKTERKRTSNDKKYRIVKEALTTDISISSLCKKYSIAPSQFYAWQEKFLEGAKLGFEKKHAATAAAEQRKEEAQAQEITRLESVVATLVSENIDLKKSDWE